MDRRQGEAKRAGCGFGFSMPHKELPLPEGTNGYHGDGSAAEGARSGFRAAEGGSKGVEDEKKRRLSPPFTPSPSSSLYAASPATARRDGGGPAAGVVGSGSSSPASSQPSCQAEKCTADLTEAKRYHRRHKVCEAHSKAPVVVVAGLRQRFCQQCSRFHELSEFDDTKRSCRRRLAGHNERRRKSSCDSQEEGSSARCRQTDHSRKIQITMPGTTPAPAYKHFQIR